MYLDACLRTCTANILAHPHRPRCGSSNSESKGGSGSNMTSHFPTEIIKSWLKGHDDEHVSLTMYLFQTKLRDLQPTDRGTCVGWLWLFVWLVLWRDVCRGIMSRIYLFRFFGPEIRQDAATKNPVHGFEPMFYCLRTGMILTLTNLLFETTMNFQAIR